MNQKEREILKIEEDIKDTLENDLINNQKENKKVKIADVKFVGKAIWADKINNKYNAENVFIIEKQVIEIDENGNERESTQLNYYLGDRCIGGTLGNNEIVFKENFEISEPDKLQAVKELLEKTNEQEIEKTSLNKLKNKELSEVLTAHLGRKVSEEETEKLIKEMDKEEIEELKEENEQREENDENDLSEKQAEKIKVSGIQKADLNKLVDGRETLGKKLDLEQYDSLYVVYSDKVDEITSNEKVNNTTYSLVGMSKDGEARVLNDEFEMDKSVGNNATREQTKIRANNIATRDNNDLSVYTRKSNGVSIGCENNQGYVDIFMYQKTLEENENVGIQIETSNTPVIPIETREIMNSNKGQYQKDEIQNEIEEHSKEDCVPDNQKDFDGIEDTKTHEHIEEVELEQIVQDILNYEDKDGEERIKEVFTENEVKEKFLRKLQENRDTMSLEQIIENVQNEMNQDAQNFEREHKM